MGKVVPLQPFIKIADDPHKIVEQKVDAFLQGLEFRVFEATGEMQVLSVYLGDDGAICIDVEEMSVPVQH